MIKILITLILALCFTSVSSNEKSFNDWVSNFKKYALKKNISEKTFDKTMSKVIFLPKVIKYDRFQPEFYEDTKTYISKRTSKKKVKQGYALYKNNKDFINTIDVE